MEKAFTGIAAAIEKYKPKPEKNLHSGIHATAREVSVFCGEPKRFGQYLGIVKRIGMQRAYQIMSEIKQSDGVKNRASLFMYKAKTNGKGKELGSKN